MARAPSFIATSTGRVICPVPPGMRLTVPRSRSLLFSEWKQSPIGRRAIGLLGAFGVTTSQLQSEDDVQSALVEMFLVHDWADTVLILKMVESLSKKERSRRARRLTVARAWR
jgi:hypothetical protein